MVIKLLINQGVAYRHGSLVNCGKNTTDIMDDSA